MGTFNAKEELTQREAMAAGDYAVRVVPGVPSTAGLLRLDQLIAAMAQTRLWLTDAYFAGTTSYIQGDTFRRGMRRGCASARRI